MCNAYGVDNDRSDDELGSVAPVVPARNLPHLDELERRQARLTDGDTGPFSGMLREAVDVTAKLISGRALVVDTASGARTSAEPVRGPFPVAVIADADGGVAALNPGASLNEATFQQLIQELEQLMRDEEAVYNVPQPGARTVDVMLERCRSLATIVRDAAEELGQRFGSVTPGEVRQAAVDFSRQLALRAEAVRGAAFAHLVQRSASTALDEANAARAAQEESAGDAGASDLAEYFDQLAKDREKEGWAWRAGTLAIAVISFAATAWSLSNTGSLSTTDTLRHLALGIPLFGLFGITTYEGSLQRRHAIWARHMATQLKSLRAYTADLSEDDRRAVRAEFARVVFAGPPTLGKEASDGPPSSANDLLTRAIAALIAGQSTSKSTP